MRIYTYQKEQPEQGNFICETIGREKFYLVLTALDKAQKQALLQQISNYKVLVSVTTVVDWDCDSSRSYDSDDDSYIEVPTDNVIIKDGQFWGYIIKAETWSGGAMYESKDYSWEIVCLDGNSVEVGYYSVTTSDYHKERTTTHTLVKAEPVK